MKPRSEDPVIRLGIAARGGLCGRCARARLVESDKGTDYLLCEDPELPKYPTLPVLTCGFFEPASPS